MEEDLVESHSNHEVAKKHPSPPRVSRPESASPKRSDHEKTESLEKVLKQREEIRRHLKPLFIKMSKIESVQALLESLISNDGFHEFHRQLVQPTHYYQLLNKLFVSMIVQKNQKPNAVPLLLACR